MPDAPIFIVGCPRSGTTLLRNLLRSHPRLTFPTESHFIPWFYRGYGHPASRQAAVALAARILRLQWVRQWNLTLQPEAFGEDRTFQAVLSRCFGDWARKEGKPRWGDKTPHYVQDIPVLAELYPSGRIIHILRDGRDVSLSWLKAGFEPRNLYTAALLWRRYVGAGRTAGRLLPTAMYLEIRYEALMADPAATMQAVCAFLGEAYDAAVLQPTPIRGRLRPRLIGNAPEPPTRPETIAPAHPGWEALMPMADRVLFESVAGDLLQELGYPISGQTRHIANLERAGWAVHHRFWWIVDRLNLRGSHRWLLADLALRGAVARARSRGAGAA